MRLIKIINIINCSLVILFMLVVGIIAMTHEKPTYSDLEKRELASMPEMTKEAYFDGSYTKDISAYIADTFPMRDKLLDMASDFKELYGFRVNDIKIHNVTVKETESIPLTEDAPSSSEAPLKEDSVSIPLTNESSEEAKENPDDIKQQEDKPVSDAPEENARATNGIYVYKKRAFEMFGGPRSMADYYADTLNYYHETFGDKVKIYNLIVPSAVEFGLPEKYKSLSVPQKPRIDYIYGQMDPEITTVNIYDILNEHKDEYIYFSTDHHWTTLGAYYAYVEFANAAGFEPVDINSLPKKTKDNFIGTLYSQTGDKSLLENPDHVDYYEMNYPVECYRYDRGEPFTPKPEPLYGEYALPVNSYSVFFHGDFPLTKIVTGNKNGRKIAVIKESYGNAFSPFLINNYEEIYVIDERYFELDLISLVEENDIDEILVINNIAAAHTKMHIDNIARIVDQKHSAHEVPVN